MSEKAVAILPIVQSRFCFSIRGNAIVCSILIFVIVVAVILQSEQMSFLDGLIWKGLLAWRVWRM